MSSERAACQSHARRGPRTGDVDQLRASEVLALVDLVNSSTREELDFRCPWTYTDIHRRLRV
jgi:hypothetical protein